MHLGNFQFDHIVRTIRLRVESNINNLPPKIFHDFRMHWILMKFICGLVIFTQFHVIRIMKTVKRAEICENCNIPRNAQEFA